MKNYKVEIETIDDTPDDFIFFPEKEIIEIREKAKQNPVTPLIVKIIEDRIKTKSGQGVNVRKQLYEIAKDVLIEGRGAVEIKYYQDNKPDKSNIFLDQSAPLNIVSYKDPMSEMEKLTSSIIDDGKIPVVWSKARGFLIKNFSKEYPLFDDIHSAKLNDPIEVIKFIISKPQDRIAYVLEDFHHYIGEKDVINPVVGEIRSLIKDLKRNLEGRNESVFLFVPMTYEIPPELNLFFLQSQNHTGPSKSYLKQYGNLLTDPEYLLRTKPLIGAEHLIQRLIQILNQMETNNPLLIGHPGVGKTAVVEGLAKAIVSGKVPGNLNGKMLYSLSLNNLVAGTRYRGDLEKRLEILMDEVMKNKDRIIVFIDEIHMLLDAGASESSSGAGDILKPFLAKGEFPCIGATTFAGVESFSRDPALARRFKKIFVQEPTIIEAIKILKGISSCFEDYHSLSIGDDALTAAVELGEKYLEEEYLPGKAISLIDGAAAYCSMQGETKVNRKDIAKEIKRLQGNKLKETG